MISVEFQYRFQLLRCIISAAFTSSYLCFSSLFFRTFAHFFIYCCCFSFIYECFRFFFCFFGLLLLLQLLLLLSSCYLPLSFVHKSVQNMISKLVLTYKVVKRVIFLNSTIKVLNMQVSYRIVLITNKTMWELQIKRKKYLITLQLILLMHTTLRFSRLWKLSITFHRLSQNIFSYYIHSSFYEK